MKKISIILTLVLLITITSCKKDVELTNAKKMEGRWLLTKQTADGVIQNSNAGYTNAEAYKEFVTFSDIVENKGKMSTESSKIDNTTNPYTVLDELEAGLVSVDFEVRADGDSLIIGSSSSILAFKISSITVSKLLLETTQVSNNISVIYASEFTKQ